MSLYAWLMLGSLAGPLFLSFDKKIHFYTYFKTALIAIAGMMALFIPWDTAFTLEGVWGFNTDYLIGVSFLHLPVEEISFFIVVPFACLFIHQVLKGYFPNFNGSNFARIFAPSITLIAGTLLVIGGGNWYTASAMSLTIILTFLVVYVKNATWYRWFVFTYFVACIPFLLVNGVLTGYVTPEPIVWYSSEHILGVRVGTIPLEDFFYNYSMLLLTCWIFEVLNSKQSKKA